MQKFSGISNAKVNTEPKASENKEHLEIESFRCAILGLLDQTLSVRNFGTGYKHDQLVSSKIDGKEMFVEALLDFLSEKENKKTIGHLESLKEKNKDWISIDEKISEIIKENNYINYFKENNIYLEKIISFLENYYLSEDFEDILEQQILKVNDYEGSIKRSEIAFKMCESDKFTSKFPKNRIRSIANKYAYRAKQLGK